MTTTDPGNRSPSGDATQEASPLGLSTAEVRARVAAGQVNVTPRPGGRTTWDIVRGNVFTWFNLILGVLFVAMVSFGSWKDALFGSILVINTIIGIVQEMRAKVALDRLSLLTTPAVKVVRDGAVQELPVADVVLDDVLQVAAGDLIVAAGEALTSQSLEVDESLLTGESVPISKEPGDKLLSGSFVVAGSGVVRATAVGADAYAQRLMGEGKRYVRLRSELMNGINGILRVIGLGIIPVGGLLIWAQFRMDATVEHGVTNTVAALVAMIPQGLVLLTSIAFAVSAITLARRNVLTRELPAVEGLARVDVLCIDKTGTITEPQPAFDRFELLTDRHDSLSTKVGSLPDDEIAATDGSPSQEVILEALAALAASASAKNSTIAAIASSLAHADGWELEDAVPFSSARKWSAARFAGRGSWVLGAPEIVAGEAVEMAAARERAAEIAAEGMRVLLFCHSDEPLRDDRLPGGMSACGLVMLAERIRPDAPETLDYFRRQGVEIKVISGDNPATVATVAAKAGVTGADRAIDARELPEGEELADLMERTTVFGRVNPDQKRSMVEALQSRGHTVAMTGDGVNDVLALKKADMGIAMGTGTAAAQAVSQLVLVDSRFSTLPGVVAEGRRVTANIERVAGLFTNKSVWAAALALAVALVGVPYLILPRHLTIIDSLTIGIPGFFLALAPNRRRFVAGFVYRVARFVIPTGLLSALTMFASYLVLRRAGAGVLEAQTMETVVFFVIGLRVIAAIERPLRGWRLGLVLAMALLLGLVFAIPFGREFFALEIPGWPALTITAGFCVFAWFFVGLGWRIGDRLPFWREAASRARAVEGSSE